MSDHTMTATDAASMIHAFTRCTHHLQPQPVSRE